MIILMVGAALAATQAPPTLFQTNATVRTLPNGLTVVVEEQRRTDMVALHLRYGVGSRDQAPEEGGCAHLFEHLMFEGSQHVPTNAFDEWLTSAGGSNNAWTSYDETAYHMTFPSGALDLGLFLESDRMGFLGAGLTAENLKNQQDVVLRERAEGYSAPHGRDWDALGLLLWPSSHPYHDPILGTEGDIRGFSLDATKGFHASHYRPSNGVLALVGNLDTAEGLAALERWFADVPAAGPAPERQKPTPLPDARIDGYIEDGVEDWSMTMAWPGPERFSADDAALDLLMLVLSNGRGTRLDDALYYKGGLATEVYGFYYSGDLGGPIALYASTPTPKLDKVAAVMRKTVAGVISKPPTEAELARARSSKRSELLEQLEEPQGRANWLADCQYYFGKPGCVADLWARYEAVTPADITRVASVYLKPERSVTLSVVPTGKGGAIKGAGLVELP